MSLKELIQDILNIARSIPNVNHVAEGDIYTLLNTNPTVDYSSVVLTQRQHSLDLFNQSMTYRFYLFYIDRETDNQSNILDIQSEAINALFTIARKIEEKFDITFNRLDINTFKERFSSECAGAYITLDLTLPISACFDDFE